MVRKCFQEKFDTFRINYIPLLLDVKVKEISGPSKALEAIFHIIVVFVHWLSVHRPLFLEMEKSTTLTHSSVRANPSRIIRQGS